jgi:hypothetical protein
MLPGGLSDELIAAVARASLVVKVPADTHELQSRSSDATDEEPIDLTKALLEAEAHEAARHGDVDSLWALLRNPALADRAASQLVRRINSVRERALRPHAIRAFLTELEDPLFLATLHRLLARSRRGEAGARAALQELALDPSILGEMPRVRAWRLVALAQRVGIDELPPLFFAPQVDKRRLVTPGSDNEFLPMPLGLRRQAARTTNRSLLDRLLRDPDPRVIAQVLNNPRLREQDVVTIAAKRPTTPAVLRTVCRHQRWSSSYRIRKTLAWNPHTPSEIACRLFATLLVQDLRFIVNAGVLLPEVEQEARSALERRQR